MEIKNSKWTALCVLFLGLFSFISCVENTPESVKEPGRYTKDDIKSYSDLFDVFWTTMNQKYNYFNEQKQDWEAVYNEYSPKFKELKTFNRDKQYSRAEISEDCDKAIQYFKDIIDPIIDRHFYVKISFPVSHSYFKSVYFRGGMKNEETIYTYPFKYKYAYMKSRVQPITGIFGEKNDILGGFLLDNPDIYYFGFESFIISRDYILSFDDDYLGIDDKSLYYLAETEIKDTVASKVNNSASGNILIEKSVECVNKFNSFIKSEVARKAINKMRDFNQSERIDEDFTEALFKAKEKAPDINSELLLLNKIQEFVLNPVYTEWFKQRLMKHLQLACEYLIFLSHIDKGLNSQYKIDFYKNFLTPLREGKIKKIILDFRGNGGGMVLDARTFIDRFVTRNTVFGYQRFKEDNNPFSYTPWIPCMTKTTDVGIKKEIPIVILIDKESASMSEISTLMLKSQGEHVTVVGHYSAGATAGLGDSDQFNGGLREKVGGYLEFYMPLLAMQDASHTVIEGVGIKPDVLLEPLTEEEVYEMIISPKTHIDRTLEQAIKLLEKK